MKLKNLKIENLINTNKEKTKVLFIYPHPDDELGMSAGLIQKLVKRKGVEVFVVSTTRGEHGDELLKLSPAELARVRTNEFSNVMKVLGVRNFELWDFTDGGMTQQESEVSSRIEKFVFEHKIDLAVTYERAGLYGHPDHIILSKIVNDLSQKLDLKVLYSTLPNKVLKRLNLPKTLTYGDEVVPLTLDTIANPEFKLNIFPQLWKRYLASREYKSQNITGGKPLWMVNLIANHEYYTTKY